MEPRRKGVDLAIIFGGKPGKGGQKPPAPGDSEEREAMRDDDDDDHDHDDDHDELPPGFEEAAVEAFPEMEGDVERLKALRRAIAACGYD